MCGVFGIYDPPGDHDRDVARLTYFGLYALQHRGQESAGIAVSDGSQVMVQVPHFSEYGTTTARGGSMLTSGG